jgi:chromosome segregation ATPase
MHHTARTLHPLTTDSCLQGALRNEVARIHKQIQSCEHIIANQESEAAKLHAIISEADTERLRQQKEFEAVASERTLLRAQLVKRDAELDAMYTKLRLQKSSLATGGYAYGRAVAERDDVASAVAALKGELLVAATQTSDGALLQVRRRARKPLRCSYTRVDYCYSPYVESAA